MTLTEEEAREKWCPFGAQAKQMAKVNEDNEITNISSLPRTARCIASECMAWLWVSEFQQELDEKGIAVGRFEKVSGKTGYCGLAGKPE